jgi:hypothetical protein
MNKLMAVVLASSLLVLPACVSKSEFEKEKQRADAAEARAKELEGRVQQADARAASLQAKAAQVDQFAAGGANLETIVNGQVIGRDGIRLAQPGRFVRHGVRERTTSRVAYSNGQLADQVFTINRESGSKMVEGPVKNSRCDGEWFWFNRDGKKTHRETFKDGKLVSVETVTVARDGKETFRKLSTADATKFFNERAANLANFPELIRER